MKTTNPAKEKLIFIGFSILFAASAGSVAAADFNPQPDPPGKVLHDENAKHNAPADKVLHNSPSNKGEHNPPGYKGQRNLNAYKTAAPGEATTPATTLQKTDKTKKLDAPKVGAIDAEKK